MAFVAIASEAHADRETLIAQGWAVGSVLDIVSAQPDAWSYDLEHNALQSNLSGLVCPENLSGVALSGARSRLVAAECWYETSTREGLWVVGAADVEEARRMVARNYATLPTDPDIELAPLETSTIRACHLEVRRMRNVQGFWVTLYDLYNAQKFYQFRTITYNDNSRAAMDTLAQRAIDISIAATCTQPP